MLGILLTKFCVSLSLCMVGVLAMKFVCVSLSISFCVWLLFYICVFLYLSLTMYGWYFTEILCVSLSLSLCVCWVFYFRNFISLAVCDVGCLRTKFYVCVALFVYCGCFTYKIFLSLFVYGGCFNNDIFTLSLCMVGVLLTNFCVSLSVYDGCFTYEVLCVFFSLCIVDILLQKFLCVSLCVWCVFYIPNFVCPSLSS